jgi:hypothetical protein
VRCLIFSANATTSVGLNRGGSDIKNATVNSFSRKKESKAGSFLVSGLLESANLRSISLHFVEARHLPVVAFRQFSVKVSGICRSECRHDDEK